MSPERSYKGFSIRSHPGIKVDSRCGYYTIEAIRITSDTNAGDPERITVEAFDLTRGMIAIEQAIDDFPNMQEGYRVEDELVKVVTYY